MCCYRLTSPWLVASKLLGIHLTLRGRVVALAIRPCKADARNVERTELVVNQILPRWATGFKVMEMKSTCCGPEWCAPLPPVHAGKTVWRCSRRHPTPAPPRGQSRHCRWSKTPAASGCRRAGSAGGETVQVRQAHVQHRQRRGFGLELAYGFFRRAAPHRRKAIGGQHVLQGVGNAGFLFDQKDAGFVRHGRCGTGLWPTSQPTRSSAS